MTDIVSDSIHKYFPSNNVDDIVDFFIAIRDEARAAGMIENTGVFSFDHDNVELHFKRPMTEDEIEDVIENARAEYELSKAKFESAK